MLLVDVAQSLGTDYYLTDELLTEEERAIRDKVRNLVDREVIPVINGYWEKAKLPFELAGRPDRFASTPGTYSGDGILLEYHVARHVTDMEAVYTYEGTDTVQSLIVGRDITGVNAFA